MDYETAELKAIRDGLSSGRYILIDTKNQPDEKEKFKPVDEYLDNNKLKQLLRRWHFFEYNFNGLDDNELASAKMLFFRLSYLPKDEKDFLAVIFRDHGEDIKLNNLHSWIASRFELENKQVAGKKLNDILDKMHHPREHPKGFKQPGYTYELVKFRGVAWYE